MRGLHSSQQGVHLLQEEKLNMNKHKVGAGTWDLPVQRHLLQEEKLNIPSSEKWRQTDAERIYCLVVHISTWKHLLFSMHSLKILFMFHFTFSAARRGFWASSETHFEARTLDPVISNDSVVRASCRHPVRHHHYPPGHLLFSRRGTSSCTIRHLPYHPVPGTCICVYSVPHHIHLSPSV